MRFLDLSSGVTALFIVGMIWLRTRMQYVGLLRGGSGHKLHLEKAGWAYFAGVVVLLALGWFLAPSLGASFWPATAANAGGIGGKGTVAQPALTRVIWFLLTYYLFIIVHRVLKARGVMVFKVREAGLA